MNDFTKEELEWLYDETDGSIEQYEYEDERAYSCRDKLKSMIDNYCEHENDIRFNAYPIDGSPKMCTKCHGFYI